MSKVDLWGYKGLLAPAKPASLLKHKGTNVVHLLSYVNVTQQYIEVIKLY